MTSQTSDSSAHEQRLAHQQLIAGRRRARRLALQALYAMAIGERSAAEVSAEFEAQQDFAKADTAYFRRILIGVESSRVDIDALLTPYLDRSIASLTPVELAILRMAMFELQSQIDVPYKAVINEAVNLAAKFGADQSFKFINGVLDRAARALRVHEQPTATAVAPSEPTAASPWGSVAAEPDQPEEQPEEEPETKQPEMKQAATKQPETEHSADVSA